MSISPKPEESVARKLQIKAEWDAIFERYPVFDGFDIAPQPVPDDCSVDTGNLFYMYFTDSGDLILKPRG